MGNWFVSPFLVSVGMKLRNYVLHPFLRSFHTHFSVPTACPAQSQSLLNQALVLEQGEDGF